MNDYKKLIDSISPTLENVIKTQLIFDKEYIEIVDKALCKYSHSIKSLSEKELLEEFTCFLGNECRSFIIKIITLDHIKQKLLENQDCSLDIYWKEALKKILDNK